MTIRRRLLAYFLGLAVLPIALTAIGLLAWVSRLAEARGRDLLAGHLDTLARLIDAEVGVETRHLASLVAEWETVGGGSDPAGWLARSRDVALRLSEEPVPAAGFLLLRAAGEGAFAVRGTWDPPGMEAFGETLPDREVPAAYRPLAVASTGVPRPATHLGPRGAFLAVAVPFPDRDGARAIAVELPILALLEHVIAQPAFAGMASCWAAADPHGRGAWTLLYHTDPVLVGLPIERGELRGIAAPWSAPDGGPGRWVYRKTRGEIHAAGVHPATGWLLGGSIATRGLVAPLRASLRWTLLALGGMASLVVAGMFLATRGIGGNVEEIAKGAAAIAAGNLEHPIRVARGDEFGAIAAHLREMARELLLTAESRSIARISSRIVHDLRGAASQMKLLAHNLEASWDDREFRGEAATILDGLAARIESLTLRLRRRDEECEPAWVPVDVAALVARVLDRRVDRGGSIAARSRIDPDCAPVADEELLEEVVDNLVANALEAMPRDGTLTVTAARLARPAGPTHALEVIDTGCGMSPEFLRERLFLPFVTTKTRGLGLGMYHVRRAVKLMGGTIDVTSEVGVGTRVRIEIGRRS